MDGVDSTYQDAREWRERGLRDAVLEGDARAWRVLYGQAFPGLYAFVYGKSGGHRQQTEDLVQETWMVALRRMKHFDPARASFAVWVRGIARNLLRAHARKAARRARLRQLFWRESQVVHPPAQAAAGAPEQVAAVLGALPPAYREVLEAKYAAGNSVVDIAEARQQSAKAVESLLTRARAAFRRAYAKMQEESESE